jgi:hypothetical protein
LIGNRCQTLALLQARVEHGAFVPEPRLGVVVAQLESATECFLCTHGIAAAQQHLSEKAIGSRVRRRQLARRYERALCLGQ